MLFARKFTTSSIEVSMNVAAEVRTNSNVWESVPNQNGSRAVGVVSVPVVLINSLTNSSMTKQATYSSSPLCLLEATDSLRGNKMTIQNINTFRNVFLTATTRLNEDARIVQQVKDAIIYFDNTEVSDEEKAVAFDAAKAQYELEVAIEEASKTVITVSAKSLAEAKKAVKNARAIAKRLNARKNAQFRNAVSAQNRAARTWNDASVTIADAMKEELRTMLLVRKAVKSVNNIAKAIKAEFKNVKSAFEVIAQSKEVARLEQQIASLRVVALIAKQAVSAA